MARLGLSYEAVAARNPRIVYLGAYGFGEQGPYAGRPAYDDLIQGQAGIAALYARQSGEVPRYAPLTLADRAVGLHAAIALVSAVLHARASGRGQQVEIPMFEGMAHMTLGDHLGGATLDPPLGPAGYARLLAPHRRPYATADGYLCLLIYNDKHWRNFFALIGQPELADDPRFRSHGARAAHIGEVYAFVADVIRHRATDDWLADLARADIPAARLHAIEDLLDDEHLAATGFIRAQDHPTEGRLRTPAPLGRYAGTPTAIRRPAPALGQHSRELLAEAGYDEAAIDALFARGAALSPIPRNPRNARWTLNSRPTSRRCAPPSPASVNAIPTNTGWSATAKAAFPSRCTPTWPATAGWASPCRRNTAAPAWA